MRAIFVRTLHICLILFRKCSVTFHLKLNMANRRHVFLNALGPETEGHIQVIRALAFRSREKFDNLIVFKVLGIV